MSGEKRVKLLILAAGSPSRTKEVNVGSVTLGRAEQDGSPPEIDLADLDLDDKISRRHARIFAEQEILYVEDLGSLNGTLFNRQDVLKKGERKKLSTGDELVIGRVLIKVEFDAA